MVMAAALLGSIPFSPLLGRLVLGRDIRTVGDGNPGATNVGRAGGRALGALAAILDIAKGAVPVALAIELAGLSEIGRASCRERV